MRTIYFSKENKLNINVVYIYIVLHNNKLLKNQNQTCINLIYIFNVTYKIKY